MPKLSSRTKQMSSAKISTRFGIRGLTSMYHMVTVLMNYFFIFASLTPTSSAPMTFLGTFQSAFLNHLQVEWSSVSDAVQFSEQAARAPNWISCVLQPLLLEL